MMRVKFLMLLTFCLGIFSNAQKVSVEILDSETAFKLNDFYNPINIKYSIKNNTSDNVYFILDKNSFGVFATPNHYYFGENASTKLSLDEKVFNPRLLLFDSNNLRDTLELNIPRIHYLVEELGRLQSIQEKIDDDSLNVLKTYKDKFYKTKSLNWVVRAKYINDNIIFLKPFEEIIVNTKVDFRNYYYDKISKTGIGYLLENKNYKMQIKIYNNPVINEYLSEANRKKIKELNVVLIDQIIFSNKTHLIVSK
ncbi:hypothetical protein [Chryseobacterium sp. YIM B08800]|uniref:hypothetical protein n=1 Tax=Chryseobacterium sp. YIM B08800 TaxID=2984136 RepID=UPI00223F8E7B|nr:hypothetical protein [Chryseobacterium sp. YIM B08800]